MNAYIKTYVISSNIKMCCVFFSCLGQQAELDGLSESSAVAQRLRSLTGEPWQHGVPNSG